MNGLGNMLGGAFQSLLGLIKRTDDTRRVFTGLISAYAANLLWVVNRAFLSLAEAGYKNNAVVYAVLTTLARAVAEPPLVAFTEDSAGTLTKLAKQHSLSKLLRSPTPGLLTMYEFVELQTLYCGAAGRFNAFIERANSGQPIGLWPLRPDRVGPIYSTLEEPEARVIKGWSYQVPGTGRFIAIPREDVFTVNLPDITGESGGLVEGFAPLQALASEVSADNEATKLVGSLLNNYATPSLAIMTKAPLPNKDTADMLKQAWMSQFGGARRGEPAILDAGAEILPLSFNLSQLEFPNLRGIAEARIAAAFGVPAALAGLKTGIDRAADANLDGMRLYFTETTCSDYWRRYEDAFTMQVAVWWGENVVCAFDRRQVRALSTQTRQEKEPIADGYAQGAVLVDEYREHVLNLDPLPNGQGQVLMVPSGVIATLPENLIEMAALPPAPPAAEPQPGSGEGTPAANAERL